MTKTEIFNTLNQVITNENQPQQKPQLILVAGSAGTGKSTHVKEQLANSIKESVGITQTHYNARKQQKNSGIPFKVWRSYTIGKNDLSDPNIKNVWIDELGTFFSGESWELGFFFDSILNNGIEKVYFTYDIQQLNNTFIGVDMLRYIFWDYQEVFSPENGAMIELFKQQPIWNLLESDFINQSGKVEVNLDATIYRTLQQFDIEFVCLTKAHRFKNSNFEENIYNNITSFYREDITENNFAELYNKGYIFLTTTKEARTNVINLVKPKESGNYFPAECYNEIDFNFDWKTEKLVAVDNYFSSSWERNYFKNGERLRIQNPFDVVNNSCEVVNTEDYAINLSRQDFFNYVGVDWCYCTQKLQGSETDNVLLVIDGKQKYVTRNLIYSALTRHKKNAHICIINKDNERNYRDWLQHCWDNYFDFSKHLNIAQRAVGLNNRLVIEHYLNNLSEPLVAESYRVAATCIKERSNIKISEGTIRKHLGNISSNKLIISKCTDIDINGYALSNIYRDYPIIENGAFIEDEGLRITKETELNLLDIRLSPYERKIRTADRVYQLCEDKANKTITPQGQAALNKRIESMIRKLKCLEEGRYILVFNQGWLLGTLGFCENTTLYIIEEANRRKYPNNDLPDAHLRNIENGWNSSHTDFTHTVNENNVIETLPNIERLDKKDKEQFMNEIKTMSKDMRKRMDKLIGMILDRKDKRLISKEELENDSLIKYVETYLDLNDEGNWKENPTEKWKDKKNNYDFKPKGYAVNLLGSDFIVIDFDGKTSFNTLLLNILLKNSIGDEVYTTKLKDEYTPNPKEYSRHYIIKVDEKIKSLSPRGWQLDILGNLSSQMVFTQLRTTMKK